MRNILNERHTYHTSPAAGLPQQLDVVKAGDLPEINVTLVAKANVSLSTATPLLHQSSACLVLLFSSRLLLHLQAQTQPACQLSGGLGGPFQPPAFVCVVQRLWEAVGAIPDTMRRGGRRAMHLVRPSIGERLQQLSVQKPLACAGWEHKCWTKGSAPLLYVQI